MFVDEVEITIKAGDGGNGKVGFRHAKFIPKGGPSGGDGGKGGDVYAEGVNDIGALLRFRGQTNFSAEDGEGGRLKRHKGKDGQDITLKLPVGCVITSDSEAWEITEEGQKIRLAKGGKGGHGNWYYRTSINQAPKYAQSGMPGGEKRLKIELRLIADVGFIGLPNAGKTSLLNELTNASAKVANYPFTTLEPNLGAMGNLILADIPGLIEGAAEGRGLGHKFLRHIQRTKILVHGVSADSTDPKKDYQVVRRELGKFDPKLLKKKEILLLTKTDMVSESEKRKKLVLLKKLNSHVLAVSVHDLDSLRSLQKLISKSL